MAPSPGQPLPPRLPQGDTSLQMQSACKLMRSIMRDDQASAPAADKLAALRDFPEALISSVPPALKATRPNGPELDAAVTLPAPLSDDLARRVREWNFNLHEVPANELPELCFGVLINHAEFHQLDINKKRLWRFVKEIASRYRSNPFHSFRHAVDVTICSGCLVRMIQAQYKEVLADPQVRGAAAPPTLWRRSPITPTPPHKRTLHACTPLAVALSGRGGPSCRCHVPRHGPPGRDERLFDQHTPPARAALQQPVRPGEPPLLNGPLAPREARAQLPRQPARGQPDGDQKVRGEV